MPAASSNSKINEAGDRVASIGPPPSLTRNSASLRREVRSGSSGTRRENGSASDEGSPLGTRSTGSPRLSRYSFNRQCNRRPPRLVKTAVTLAVSTVISRSDVSVTTACGSPESLETAAPDCCVDGGASGTVPVDGAWGGLAEELDAAGFAAGGGGGAKYVW